MRFKRKSLAAVLFMAALSAGTGALASDLGQESLARRLGASKAVFPAYYNLKDHGLATPVKDRGIYRTDLIFAALASLESSALKAKVQDPDYSEMFMACWGLIDQPKDGEVLPGFGNYSAGDFPDRILNDSGKGDIIALLARGTGAVSEKDGPYVTSSMPDPDAPVIRTLKDVYVYDLDDEASVREATALGKYGIMTHGALAAAICFDPASYNGRTWALYNREDKELLQYEAFVTVVGWDDDFPKESFTSTPPGPGAWIVKDSRGTSWGNQGYFYISYYDDSIEEAAAFVGCDPKEFDSVYQYDPLGRVGETGKDGKGHMANVFTAREDTMIRAVAFYSLGSPTDYSISICTGSSGIPSTGTIALNQSGSFEEPGYRTVLLKRPVPVKKGEKFSVQVRLNAVGEDEAIAIEYAKPGYSGKASANQGESFISRDGIDWEDITLKPGLKTANVCLKALCRRGAAPEPSPEPGPEPQPGPEPEPGPQGSGGGGGGCLTGFGPGAALLLLPLFVFMKKP